MINNNSGINEINQLHEKIDFLEYEIARLEGENACSETEGIIALVIVAFFAGWLVGLCC